MAQDEETGCVEVTVYLLVCIAWVFAWWHFELKPLASIRDDVHAIRMHVAPERMASEED